MKINLGLNTGFAINRYTTPEQWIPLVAEELGIKHVQFTADLLNPSMPEKIVLRVAEKTKNLADRYGLSIDCTFTSAFTRVNHFSHPDDEIRNYWVEWFKKFIDVSLIFGAKSVGSHFGILTVPDLKNKEIRQLRFRQAITCWHTIGEYAQNKGLSYMTWEPMSLPREYGETISEAHRIHQILNLNAPIPFLICLDVDHGDVSSSNPGDTDPYEWLRTFSNVSPEIHIKQRLKDKGGHWPFTKDNNEKGVIHPEKVIAILKENGLKEVLLLLELSFREREPAESNMILDLKESINYWNKYCE